MDISEAIGIADKILSAHLGQHLSDIERAVLRGSLQKLKYEVIGNETYQSYKYVKDIGSRLWRKLSIALDGEEVKKSNIQAVLERHRSSLSNKVQQSPQPNFTDWADAPEIESFLGRHFELDTLRRWTLQDRCRLIAIVGMGGVGKTGLTLKLGRGGLGKTNLSLRLARGIQHEFSCVIWRSLLNAPAVDDTLRDLIYFISQQQETNLPETLDAKILLLLTYLKRQRCLLILDNIESILIGHSPDPAQSTNLPDTSQAGHYRKSYEGYGQLFQTLGEVPHQSCLILTSREKPKNLQTLTYDHKKVRFFQLQGLEKEDAIALFRQNERLLASDDALAEIVRFYEGNPLALKLVIKRVLTIFDGDISTFRSQENPFFGDINELLDWHFRRLSLSEKEVLYWLALNREPTPVSILKKDCLSIELKDTITDILDALQLRLPINITASGFTLQPVIIEYLTEKLIKLIAEEILSGKLDLLNRICLQKGLAKTYICKAQNRLVVQPIAQRLCRASGQSIAIHQLDSTLSLIKATPALQSGYATGNLITLYSALRADLTGYDFSHLTIRQTNFQGISLKEVNFSFADLSTAVFTQSFGGVHSITFSPDNQHFAIGDSKGQIHILRRSDNQQVSLLTGHALNLWITSLAYFPTGPLLASSSFDTTVRIWNTDTKTCLQVLAGHTQWVWSVAVSPDGRQVASGSDDCTIRLWNVDTGDCLHQLIGHANWVWAVAFSPDGKMLASGSYDHTIRLWDIETGDCLHTLKGHQKSVWSLAFSPNGKLLVSGSLDHTIRIWDMATQQCTKTLTGHSKEVRSVAFAPQGDYVVSGGFDGTIKRWDVSTGQCLSTFSGHRAGVRTVAMSPDGLALASGDHSQSLRLWDPVSGHCLQSLEGHTDWVWSVEISPDQQVIASGGLDGIIRLWCLRTGECVQRLEGHGNWIWQVAFSPDGKTLASCGDDETIKLWNLESGRCLKTLKGHQDGGVWAIDFDQSGNILISGGQDGTVRFWSLNHYSLRGDNPQSHSLQGSSVDTINIQAVKAHENWIWSVDFNHDSSCFASCSDDGTIKLWDTKTANLLRTFAVGGRKILSLQWINTQNVLAIGHDDGSITLWQVSNGRQVKVLYGHQYWVLTLAFDVTSSILVSGAQDSTARIWDINTGECLGILTGHKSWVTSVDVNVANNIIVTGSADGTIKIWDFKEKYCLRTIRLLSPYDDMIITGAVGLTTSQRESLTLLGAR